MEKILYIIRHGETDFNKQGVVQGSGVDSDLNEMGRKQADLFYQAYHHISFDKIFTSALKRTRQSVQKFIDKKIPHESLTELNEISWGVNEGKVVSPQDMKHYMHYLKEWSRGHLEAKIEGGESPLEMYERQKIALQKIIANDNEKNILVSTHGRYLRGFMCLLTNTPLHLMDMFDHTNLCLYVVKYDGEKFEILEHNNQSHLD